MRRYDGVMRLGVISGLALLCVLGPTVSADDGGNVWDRTYKKGGWGGSSPPCPDSLSDVTVKNGRFTLPWDVKVHDKPVNIGRIEGTVRPSGLATATVVFADPLPAAFVEAMREDNDSIEDLRKEPVKVKFQEYHDGREINVYTERWQCHTWWKEDRASLQAAADGGTVNCNSGAYAVALWSDKREYKTGDYARLGVPGQAVRLYRCVDRCEAGIDPRELQEVHEVQKWAFIGACADQKSPDTPLPAKGSSKFDNTYDRGMFYIQDWRCPAEKEVTSFVVKNGRFSLPWYLSTDLADGQKYEDMQVGHLDGVVADDGKVTLRYVWTVDKLPPEVLEAVKYDKGHATLEYMNTLNGQMKFDSDTGAMNPSGQGVKAEITFNGDNNCDYRFAGKGYKPQEFKESDGWTIDCYSYSGWKSDSVYKQGEQAVVDGGLYRCTKSQCKTGSRPGRSSQWERVGRCK